MTRVSSIRAAVSAGDVLHGELRGIRPGGTLIPESQILEERWTDDTATVVLSEAHAPDALLVTKCYGTFVIDLWVWGCPNGCLWVHASAPLRVITEPDSVVAYPEAGSTTMGAIGTTATWLGDIYLPGETISAVPLFWSSLDPNGRPSTRTGS